MSAGLQPERVDIIGDHLAIIWNDAAETVLTLDALRAQCPCAACSGEPDGLFEGTRRGSRNRPENASLLRIEAVGAYALRPVWADGHSTGIYSFDYLRNLPDNLSGIGKCT